MTIWLRQSTATTLLFGPFVDATDGSSYKATTITIGAGAIKLRRSNDGGNTPTGLAGAVSLVVPGWALLPIAVTDVGQLGPIQYFVGNITGNVPVWADYMVMSPNVYDSLVPGTDNLHVDVLNMTTGVAVTSIAAAVGVNVSSVNAGVGVNASSINGVAATSITFNANVLLVTGAAVSSAVIGSVGNLTTGVAVTSVAAGVGVNVSSIAAGVGVNVTSIAGAAPTDKVFGVNLLTITGAAVSDAMLTYFASKIAVQVVTGVNVTALNGGPVTNVIFGVNLLTISGAAVSDAMLSYFASKIAVQVVTQVNAAVATTVNANVLLITGGAVSDAAIGSVANFATGVHVSSIAAGVGVNVSSVNAGVGIHVTSLSTGVHVTSIAAGKGVNVSSINGLNPTDVVFNANLVLCTGAAPSNAVPEYIWRRILATPPGQTIEAGDYLKIIGAAVAGRCSGATSAAGLIVFYGPSGDAKVSGSFASGNRTGATWVT